MHFQDDTRWFLNNEDLYFCLVKQNKQKTRRSAGLICFRVRVKISVVQQAAKEEAEYDVLSLSLISHYSRVKTAQKQIEMHRL